MKVHTALLALAAVSLLSAEYLRADGTEGLGTPSIPLQSGTGIVAGGTGMLVQPGVIALDVPPASLIKQVVLYWQGFAADAAGGDATVALANGGSAVTVTGVLIGGPTLFFDGAWASTYRADITALGLVAPGLNSLTVSDMAFGAANNESGRRSHDRRSADGQWRVGRTGVARCGTDTAASKERGRADPDGQGAVSAATSCCHGSRHGKACGKCRTIRRTERSTQTATFTRRSRSVQSCAAPSAVARAAPCSTWNKAHAATASNSRS